MSENDITAARLLTINKKGWAVAQKLIELKANQDVSLDDLGNLYELNLVDKKEERLRRFLDLINSARARLLTKNYGFCLKCRAPFADAVLDEMPWVEVCPPCAPKEGNILVLS
jgi:RNA polymerase-binding transcription factor DksA